MPAAEKLLMIIDPETREAYREGEGPAASGPLFFTSRELLERYCREESIERYEVYEVPAGILARMKGRPYWLDGRRHE